MILIIFFGILTVAATKPLFSENIVGGTTAPDIIPWVATILSYHEGRIDADGAPIQEICGGVLVSPTFIITAAHCLKEVVGDLIIITNSKTRDSSTSSTVIKWKAIKYLSHLQFNRETHMNDIALIYVKIVENKAGGIVKPIVFSSISTNTVKFFAYGFGTMTNGNMADNLQVVDLYDVPVSICKQNYEGNTNAITPSQLCASAPEGGKDTCGGDSGGSLVSMTPNGPVLEGITSWGPSSCGEKGKPGVYTRISLYADWIIENMNGLKTDDTNSRLNELKVKLKSRSLRKNDESTIKEAKKLQQTSLLQSQDQYESYPTNYIKSASNDDD